MQFVGARRVGPGFLAHAGDGLRIELAEIGGVLSRDPAPAHDRLGAALFKRRVIQERIGPRRQHFHGERRRLDEIAGDDADGAGFQFAQQLFEAGEVHCFLQTIVDRLVDQRMIRHLALADDVLGAGELIGENIGDEVFGVHARQLRRHFTAAPEARQRQGDAGDPAPARQEHRRVEQRLDQHLAHARRMQIGLHVGQLEAMH